MQRLERILQTIDGRGYRAYKQLRGSYRFEECTLLIDHVQGDPYAAPSRLRAVVPWQVAQLPEHALAGADRRRAARDFIARTFRRTAREVRAITIDAGGQTVLERTACLFNDEGLELRFRVDLPAGGRRILGRQARDLLCRTLPRLLLDAACARALDLEALARHGDAVEDQVALRHALDAAGLVAFVAEGARLPRRSGVDDRPAAEAVPIAVPETLRVELSAPNAGTLVGLGIPRGITLIVGGGFHGKSTLIRALEMGIYDHLPGDGREQVVTDPTAVKIRAEDGRAVSSVDISPLIDNLPQDRSTSAFTTELASGSTSQAAALIEALEAGSRTLLIDEDTSATNFMIRDRRMQVLVRKSSEPITPFVDRI
ncbi:MAG: ABC-ATPase domain-containing protein, partial [bacterium]|nr:ABC-ATPase domain-containing protein [bacterium]